MTETRKPLQVMDLSKVFNGRNVLRNICLTLEQSECVILTGANGAGKTTLLRCLAGAVRPNAGTVLWFQRPARADSESLRQIGFVAHESRLYAHLTLRENLIFAARMSDVQNPRQRADDRRTLSCSARSNSVLRGIAALPPLPANGEEPQRGDR